VAHSDEELDHLDYWIPTGLDVERFKDDPDLFRTFRLIGREEHTAYALHPSGAVVEMTLDLQGRVVFRHVVRGQAAERLRLKYGFDLDAELYNRLVHALQKGSPAEPALQKLFGPRLLALGHLDIRLAADGAQVRTYRLPGGALLEVRLAADGTLSSYETTQGEAASWKLQHADFGDWDVPEARRDMLQEVATWGEALLVVRMDGGRPEHAREDWAWQPTRTTVLGTTQEGPKRWQFTIADRRTLDPLALGDGVSAAFDPADALLFASGVQRGDPLMTSGNPRVDRFLAAAAVRKALRAFPEGADELPDEALHTTVSRWMKARQPERFTRAAMEALVTSLAGT
jgi:hypothetical protein